MWSGDDGGGWRKGRTGVVGLAVSNINMTYSAELARAVMEDPAVDHVAIDNDAGLELAIRHLLEFGRRRVAFVGGSLDGGTGMVVQRIRGYVRALVAAGMEVDDALVVPTSRGLDGGRAAAAMILSAGAAGAVCVTDTVALGLLRGLADAGVLVPDEVPVVGFDNIQPASYAVPSLITIDPHVGELVETAVGMLLERMRGFDGAGRLHVGRCVLIRRKSTAL